MRQIILFFLFGLLLVSFSGCNTIKGTASGAAEGFSKDWQEAKKIDGWLQEHAW